MEEAVGIRWHRLVTRLASRGYPAARVTLETEGPRLALILRALGSDAGLSIKASSERSLRVRRPLLQRLAGTGRRHALAWREPDSLHLPAQLQVFAEARLNRELYLWLTVLASEPLPTADDAWRASQARILATLARFPGLRGLYHRLAQALIGERGDPASLPRNQREREVCIQTELLQPGSQSQLPPAPGEPLPVPLWLYTADGNVDAVPPATQAQVESPPAGGQIRQGKGRKQARYVDDPGRENGLMIFRLESLFSWSEFVPVDRCQDDREDLDAESTAADLDFLSLARSRSTSASRIKLDLDLPSAAEDDLPLGEGCRYPEWDWRKRQLLPDHCSVVPLLPRGAEAAPLPPRLASLASSLRRRFEGLRPQRAWLGRQASGSQLDLQACLAYTCQRQRGNADSQPLLWRSQVGRQRDLACLMLADLSLSTEAWADDRYQVIDVIRDSLHLFGEALHAGQDSFAMYGFSSRRRNHVRFSLIKNFDEAWGDAIHGRIQALKPGYYTRMGAAIRQATDILRERPAEQRLLLLLTDGKPNDLDIYEGRYGMEDTRHALREARQAGVQPFCVTIDQQASDYLPYLFGQGHYRVIRRAAELPELLPRLYLLLTGGAGR